MYIRAFLLLALSVATLCSEWDRFRGPNGSGITEADNLPTEFGAGKNVIWRVDFPAGHSSPVLRKDRIFLTGVENGELYTFSVDRRNGTIVWRQKSPRPRREKLHALNHPASSTPVTDGKNVYVFFPEFGLLSYTWDGRERWRLPLGPFNNVYGIGVSPVLADDNVVLVIDQNINSFILTADKNTGKIRWQRPRPEALSGASTPTILKPANGPALILAPSSFRMDVYSAKDGEAVWWVKGLPSEMKSVPVVHGDVVYISGFNTPENDPGRQIALPSWEELIAKSDSDKDGFVERAEAPDNRTRRYWEFLDLDANGKLDSKEWNQYVAVMAAENGLYAFKLGNKGDATANLLWKYQRSIPQLPSIIVYNGFLYMINDSGVLTTINPETGQQLKQGRLRAVSDNYYASPIAADNKLFVASHSGVVAVLRAGPDQHVISANELNEEIFATPAISDNRLYVRTVSALYCFGLK